MRKLNSIKPAVRHIKKDTVDFILRSFKPFSVHPHTIGLTDSITSQNLYTLGQTYKKAVSQYGTKRDTTLFKSLFRLRFSGEQYSVLKEQEDLDLSNPNLIEVSVYLGFMNRSAFYDQLGNRKKRYDQIKQKKHPAIRSEYDQWYFMDDLLFKREIKNVKWDPIRFRVINQLRLDLVLWKEMELRQMQQQKHSTH